MIRLHSLMVVLGSALMLACSCVFASEDKPPAGMQTVQVTITHAPPAQTVLTCSRTGTPKNVILLVGDGMGLNDLSAAKAALGPAARTHTERSSSVALCSTNSANGPTTDSAAAATALLCGEKANRGSIGQAPDGRPLTSLFVKAKQAGKRTAILTSDEVTEATPAAAYAHVAKRGNDATIARQLLDSDIDLVIGGGRSVFRKLGPSGGAETTGAFLDGIPSNGFRPVQDLDSLRKVDLAEGKVMALLAEDSFDQTSPTNRLDLPAFTRMAIEKLNKSAPNGFLLLVEGTEMDDAAHDGNAALLLNEMVDFDQAVGQALEFAELDKETLVIVTGDHETGGVGLGAKVEQDKAQIAFACDGHTPALVPLMATGVGAPSFHGFIDNTDVAKIISSLMKQRR
ncbi:MAG: alkaline phosphatase [Candidatus Hydrogenedentes bacterium]|nr:alkaline phosphatase [Candidatus Hydrogenedentota bacterium]